MLVVLVLNIIRMKINIYVKLLNEGSLVYRPVPAKAMGDNIYQLGGIELYDPEDELWEFMPGTLIEVEMRNLEGEQKLVAIKEKINN
jgi:hypothetical protein